jgi:hypothetical protein
MTLAFALIALFGAGVFAAFLVGVEGWDYANTIALWMFAATVIVFVTLGLFESAAADWQRSRERGREDAETVEG